MLTRITVNNLFLFKKSEFKPHQNLNILIGETGAGKSFLLDLIKIVFGFKSAKKNIEFQDDSFLALECDVSDSIETVKDFIKSSGIVGKDLNQIVIRKEFRNRSSKLFINDRPVSQGFISELGGLIVDFNSQGDQFRVFNKKTYLELIDNFGHLKPEVNLLNDIYNKYSKIKEKIIALERDEEKKQKELDYLNHCIQELEDLDSFKGEEEDLKEKKRQFMLLEKRLSFVQECQERLLSAENSATDILSSVSRSCYRNNDLVTDASKVELLENAISNIDEFINYLTNSIEEYEVDIDQIQERLFALNEVARKHRCSSDELPEILTRFKETAHNFISDSQKLEDMRRDIKKLEQEYSVKAKELSEKRLTSSKSLEEKILLYLRKIGLPKAVFKIQHQLKKDIYSYRGMDEFEFLASMNPGMKVSKIDQVASGGELSRFLLALKAAMADQLKVGTLIFDEVDTGVSGKTLFEIADILKDLTKNKQVFVITHSPQIASKADKCLFIKKQSKGDETFSEVIELTKEQQEEEIANLIASRENSDSARILAKEYMKN